MVVVVLFLLCFFIKFLSYLRELWHLLSITKMRNSLPLLHHTHRHYHILQLKDLLPQQQILHISLIEYGN